MRPGELLDERYRLEAEIGSGGMGTVWRATDTRIARTVALKVLHRHLATDEEFRTRFAREARAVGALQHRGVVGLYDFTETTIDGEPAAYLVMEYAAGESLGSLLRDRTDLTIDKVLSILADAAEALQAAHDLGIVHRDVKPDNIIVNDDGVRLIDFGIAQAPGEYALTSPGLFMGSLQYVAPEQLKGQAPSAASDVYSLGVVAYEALSGRTPFAGDTPAAVLSGHLHDEPEPLPAKVPDQVARIVSRALAKEPAERFESAADFAVACREGSAGAATTAPRGLPPQPVSKTSKYPAPAVSAPRRRVWPFVMAIAVVIVLAAGAAWWFFGGLGPGDPAGNPLHAFEKRGEAVAFSGSDSSDLGMAPAPVSAGGVGYFANPRDDGSTELTAVDMATGKREWQVSTTEPTGHALHASDGVLYTADSEAGVVNILDIDSGESLKVIEYGAPISVDTIGDQVLVFEDGSSELTAYEPDGSQAWSRDFASEVTDVDPVGKWKGFTPPGDRVVPQQVSDIVVYTRDGTVWSLSPGGKPRDSVDSGETGGVTGSWAGTLFTATPDPSGSGYTVTARDISEGFEVVGRWSQLRDGHAPRKMIRCGESRLCVLDRVGEESAGAVVIDFTDSESEPLWQSAADEVVSDVFAAGNTTAVVREQNNADDSATQLYDAEFSPLGKASLGTYRAIDSRNFVEYPVTPGDSPHNPLDEHYFTGRDARDGATHDLGAKEVFPRCVTDGAALACPTSRGISVWEYKDT